MTGVGLHGLVRWVARGRVCDARLRLGRLDLDLSPYAQQALAVSLRLGCGSVPAYLCDAKAWIHGGQLTVDAEGDGRRLTYSHVPSGTYASFLLLPAAADCLRFELLDPPRRAA